MGEWVDEKERLRERHWDKEEEWEGCELTEKHLTPFAKYLSSKWTIVASTSS
jgi:hypothetical protein